MLAITHGLDGDVSGITLLAVQLVSSLGVNKIWRTDS